MLSKFNHKIVKNVHDQTYFFITAMKLTDSNNKLKFVLVAFEPAGSIFIIVTNL